jgi:type I restriction enzyme S subunit
MNLETFFEKFDQVADAPDAVAKMRELVLQLAVRGQLVPQDPKDEPASKATERLLVQNSTGQTSKTSAKRDSEEAPFEIPMSWKWVRFGDLVRIRTGKLDANAAVEGGRYPFFTCSKTPSQIDTHSFDTSAVILAGNGDFNLKSYSGKFDAYQRTYVIEPLGWELGFCFWLISAQIKRITDKQRGSAIPYLRLGDIADPLVPFPPLAEQKRIVAKVDELMALCDRLETQQHERETRHAALARASLARFADAPTPANLPFLFHPSYAIAPADLRKSILTLAVQGKLVPQDPNTENLAKADLNSLLEIRKSSTLKLTKIEAEEETSTPAMPDSWLSVALGELVSIRTGFAFKSGDYTDKGTFILRVTNINPDGSFDTGNSVFLPASKLDKKMKGFLLEENELLVVMVGGSLGKIGQVTAEILPALLNQNMWRLKPYSDHMDFRFLRLLLSDLNENRLRVTTSTHGHLAMGTYAAAKVPFPPLAEQRRIVAKVDQLMALVDVLETQLAASRDKGQKLLEAIVSELTLTS